MTDLKQLRREVEEGLDSSMFAAHPNGYTCRCGLVESCVCASTWPELVVAEQGVELKRLRANLFAVAARLALLENRNTLDILKELGD